MIIIYPDISGNSGLSIDTRRNSLPPAVGFEKEYGLASP
jgi:hypothetical protein